MEYTLLSDFEIRPGKLTLWSATNTGEWAPDTRPLSTAHAEYCASVDNADPRPGRGRWIGTIFEMDAPFDHEAVHTMARWWHARHEGLRTTVHRLDESAEWLRRTCPETGIDVRFETVETVGDSAELNDFLRDALELRLSPLIWPHCLIATVEHADSRDFTVLVAADHSVMDAYGQLLVISELRRLYYAALAEAIVPPSQTCTGSAEFAAVERSAAAALTAECEAVAVWREFLAKSDGALPRFQPGAVTAVADTEDPAPQHSVSRWLLDAAEADAVEAALDAVGQRATAGVFAALALAARNLFHTTNYRTVMPVATRPPQWAESMGWFVNILPVDIELTEETEFTAALDITRAALRRAKPAAFAPASRVFDLLEVTDRPRFGASFVDTRRLPNIRTLERLRWRALRADSHSADEVYFWIGRPAQGWNISARFPAAYSDTAMHRYIDEVAGILREFGAEHSGAPLRAEGAA
ncbi:condensation domain-containing protein [Nocardia sp. NPDC050406]|uniref:condensation domain-containing protein n=1 Tax=Nocardia sp. NPDC050406 TaxID=3364318 RepID=UPI00379DB5AE